MELVPCLIITAHLDSTMKIPLWTAIIIHLHPLWTFKSHVGQEMVLQHSYLGLRYVMLEQDRIIRNIEDC